MLSSYLSNQTFFIYETVPLNELTPISLEIQMPLKPTIFPHPESHFIHLRQKQS